METRRQNKRWLLSPLDKLPDRSFRTYEWWLLVVVLLLAVVILSCASHSDLQKTYDGYDLICIRAAEAPNAGWDCQRKQKKEYEPFALPEEK